MVNLTPLDGIQDSFLERKIIVTRLFASITAIAVAICVSLSMGCGGDNKSGKDGKGGATGGFALDSEKGDLKLDKEKAVTTKVKVKSGEIKEITDKPAADTKVTATVDSDNKGITITAEKDAKVGDHVFKIKSKDDKTASYTVSVKAP